MGLGRKTGSLEDISAGADEGQLVLSELLYHFRDIVIGPHLDERRATARARCNLAVSCQTPSGARVGVLKDISVQGARLLTDEKWKKGTTVTLMPPKGLGGEKGGLKAAVAWSRPVHGEYQVGLKFRSQVKGTWVGKLLHELGLSSAIPRQRRQWIRVPSDTRVNYSAHGSQRDALLTDISVGGALISSKELLSRGAQVRLDIPASNEAPALTVTGRCCGCKKSEAGAYDVSIQFDDLDAKQRKTLVKHLSELMRRALAR